MKAKIEEKILLEIVGVLDKDQNDEYVVCVEDKAYNLNDILDRKIGQEVQFKFVSL